MKKGDLKFLENQGTRFCVYGLVCPDTKKLKYIGKANDAWCRYRKHISAAKRGHQQYVCRWIAKLLSEGKKPLMVIMKLCFSEESAFRAEVELIDFHKKRGETLCNLTPGGYGCPYSVVRARAGLSPKPPSNPRLVTHEERMEKSKQYRILSSEQIKEIKALKPTNSYSVLGKKYGVSPGTIFLAVKDKYYGEARGTILS